MFSDIVNVRLSACPCTDVGARACHILPLLKPGLHIAPLSCTVRVIDWRDSIGPVQFVQFRGEQLATMLSPDAQVADKNNNARDFPTTTFRDLPTSPRSS